MSGAGDFWTDERIEELKRLVALGWSGGQTAKALGISRSAAIGKAFRLKLQFGSRPASDPAAAKVRKPRKSPALSMKAKATPPKSSTPVLAVVEQTHKHFTERRYGECAYPIHGHGENVFSCCAPVKGEGASYCLTHAKIMFKTPARKDEREAARRRFLVGDKERYAANF